MKDEDIVVIKVSTGEDVILEAAGEDEHFLIYKNAVSIKLQMQQGQVGLSFQHFPIYANQEPDTRQLMPKTSIVYSYIPSKEILENYKQTFSGIIVPDKKIILG